MRHLWPNLHGGVRLISHVVGSIMGAVYAFIAGLIVYGILKATIGIRLSPEDEHRGADLAIHKIGANPEEGLVGSR